MLRAQRHPSSALIIVLFALLPVFSTASESPADIAVAPLGADYSGDLANLVEAGIVQPLSLATADFDEDGMPDLVVGYGDGQSGLFVVHNGNIEAVYPRPGEDPGEPFHQVARVFSSPQRADFVATGDFDADGHFDIVTAMTGGVNLELHSGNGSGLFAAAESIELGGRLTTLTSGEVNRRDGLADIVVGVDRPSGPTILVFESPIGAMRGTPEVIDAVEKTVFIELGFFDDDSFRDIVAVTESHQITVVGRDRRLSLGQKQRSEVAEAIVFAEPLAATAHTTKSATLPFAEHIDGEILAHLSMRLNRDAIPDSVVVTDDSPVPVVVKTLSRATFTVDSTADDPDFSTGDGVCDTDDSVGDGPCTLRAALQQANADAGADAIEFNIPGTGPHTIQPITALPTITDAVTIDGFTQPGASANTIAFPGALDTVLQVELDGSAAVSAINGLALSAGSCVVRGLVINRMPKTNNIYLGSGIYLSGSANSIVEGNFLGTDPGGTTALPNEFYGVFTYTGGAGNIYGGTAPPARNLITSPSVNLAHREGDGALIQGNLIGTDISGTIGLNLGTGVGIYLVSAEGYGGSTGDNHTVGGTTAGAGNLVSGHYWGIKLLDDTSGNLVQGNLIGPDASGASVLGNQSAGIQILWNENNTIGGTSPAARNVISGLAVAWSYGINVQEAPGTQVQGNYIGTDVTGTAGYPFFLGLYLNILASGVTIGGSVPGAGNLIAASVENGILLGDSSNVIIQGNDIGLDATGSPLGNSKAGISMWGCSNITIGGTTPGEGNTIANNGAAGVEIGNSWGVSDPGIEVVGNSIHSNALLGIDIETDGVTPNDAGDADTGSNGWQNFPVISSVTGGGTQVSGTLNSLASAQYELAFYSSSVCDATGYGEGTTFLGTDTVTTNASGDAAFTSSLTTAVTLGSWVTATATDPNGSTSEFSVCLQYTDTADLSLTKDDGVTSVIAGGQVTYTIVASNPSGPDDAIGSTVTDTFPVDLSCSWTCVGAGGASCTAGPVVGDISDSADLPVGGTATYTAVCDVAPSASGTLSNTATVAAPAGVTDPNLTNNAATDIDTILELDLGDAPDPTYPTLHASDGARHVLGGALYLGATVDADADGQPTADADGDDTDGTDDEDGVAFTSVAMTGYAATVDVVASATGLLNAWVDFNADGDWLDAGEQIFTDEPVAAGINPLVFSVPAAATLGDTFARFRVDTVGGLAPTGLATDGEVEDELLEIRFSALEVSISGQITSYSAGDDGAYQSGVPWPEPRFTDHGDGTMTDELTGLMWTQDNVTPGPPACTPGIRKNWYDSLAHVDCLNTNSYLGYTDWRMPNATEIMSLANHEETDQRTWLAGQGFTLSPWYYWWSSTTAAQGLSSTWVLGPDASDGLYQKTNATGITLWPVRGSSMGSPAPLAQTGQIRCWNSSHSEIPCAGTGQDGDHRAGVEWPSPRFEVAGDCVTDRLTGLMWTKDGNPFGAQTWWDALDSALSLDLCGYDDWRLPSRMEVKTLIHYDRRPGLTPPTMPEWWESQGFVNTTRYQPWSGTSQPTDPHNWAFKMQGRSSKDDPDTWVAWPVRGNLDTAVADLSVELTDSPDPVAAGATLTYTVTASNLGPSTVDQVTVTTTLDAAAVFVGATGPGWTCGEDTGVVTCTYGSLAVESAPPISIEITTPNAPGATLTSLALVDSPYGDPVPDNNAAEADTEILGADFGDAPDPTYPTLLASDGARHAVGGALFLGATVDSDPDGQPTAGADGDDLDGTDDEDGVAFTSALRLGLDASISVEASTAGLLNAWIDFNADGDWDDPGEQIFTDTALTAGTNALVAAVPIDAALGATFARFRVDSTGGLTPTGAAADGEVEDHAVTIDPSAELGVNIGDSPDPVRQGRRLTYSVAVDNNGGLDATGVVLTDTLDGNVSFVSASLPACSETGGVVTCNLDTLSAGTSAMIFVEVDVNPAFAGVISNTAIVTLTEEDPIPANNTDIETTTVVAPGPHVFSDGFETGDTNRWSSTVGD